MKSGSKDGLLSTVSTLPSMGLFFFFLMQHHSEESTSFRGMNREVVHSWCWDSGGARWNQHCTGTRGTNKTPPNGRLPIGQLPGSSSTLKSTVSSSWYLSFAEGLRRGRWDLLPALQTPGNSRGREGAKWLPRTLSQSESHHPR